MADNADLGEWTNDVYLLDKEPRGPGGERLNNSRIVGIDPGVSAMVTGTSTQEEESQPGLWMNQFSVPTRNYHAKTNVFWEYKQELVNRRKFRIEQEYDLLRNNSANVSESADFARHIFVLSMMRARKVDPKSVDTYIITEKGYSMKMFNEHFKHREIRRTMFSARQSTKHQIVNQLLGVNTPISPVCHIHLGRF
ncbi:hypothetical protein BJV82DRAFT_408568 [Fennellomyces sp. T-0311]|nr:hypothetical protein BJV82DRAFT_408568 [Fennellomyces sp. T-0311]